MCSFFFLSFVRTCSTKLLTFDLSNPLPSPGHTSPSDPRGPFSPRFMSPFPFPHVYLTRYWKTLASLFSQTLFAVRSFPAAYPSQVPFSLPTNENTLQVPRPLYLPPSDQGPFFRRFRTSHPAYFIDFARISSLSVLEQFFQVFHAGSFFLSVSFSRLLFLPPPWITHTASFFDARPSDIPVVPPQPLVFSHAFCSSGL